MRKLLTVLAVVFVSSTASSKELLYAGKDFTLTVPAYDLVTVEVPCEVTSESHVKEKLDLKEVKTKDRTILYLLPKEETVFSVSCVDRTYTFKVNPVDTKPKKKLECKDGKCQIVEEKPKVDFSKLSVHYVVVDPSIVKEETVNPQSSFSDKSQIVDQAVRLLKAMVLDEKPAGYVVRKKELSYYLTPDLKVSLVKFYKGLLFGQVVKVKNESYFPVKFNVKSLDGNGNVLVYSPQMSDDGEIVFAPKSEALLYVVQVRKRLKLPFKQVAKTSTLTSVRFFNVPKAEKEALEKEDKND